MTTIDQLPEAVSLYCTKDGANKEYHLAIEEVAGGFVVRTRFGARGNAKVPKGDPKVLSRSEAIELFNSIYKEKTSAKKGYTQEESGQGYATAELAGQMSGNKPHLLVACNHLSAAQKILDDNWAAQEKINGERAMVEAKDGAVVTSNKNGVINSLNIEIVEDVARLGLSGLKLDGEWRDNKLHVFDFLHDGVSSLEHLSLELRYQKLCALFANNEFKALLLVKMVFASREKQELLARVYQEVGEGVVFKEIHAPYLSGKAAPSQATQFKFKFVEDSSCLVVSVHPKKSSVGIALLNEQGDWIPVGNVRAPSDVLVGSVIDVQYRHLNFDGALIEPVFLKLRTDVPKEECVLTQVTRIVKKGDAVVDDQDDAASLSPCAMSC